LTREEIERIEKTANDVVRKNLPLTIKIYERGEAEQKYTFRIYQGGVVPSSNVRIVNIEGWDIEACGGTHVGKTGEIGLIKIVKSERIQDGVIRLEFVVGDSAIRFIQTQETNLNKIANVLGSSKEKVTESLEKVIEDSDATKRRFRALLKKTSNIIADNITHNAKNLSTGIRLYSTQDDVLGEEYFIAVGERSIEADPLLIFIALVMNKNGIRVIVFVGSQAQKIIGAGRIAKEISAQLGGSGGGNDRFGQGGGKLVDSIDKCLKNIEDTIINASSKNDKKNK
jgi:alanyl-tRNA synthetase